jgi:hypothetical protein
MSPLVKVILILAAVGLLLVVAVVGGVAYWVSRHGREYIDSAQQAVKEGMQTGSRIDARQCVVESVNRHKKDSGFGAVIATRLFLTGCLKTAAPVEGFCDDVPRVTAIMDSAKWQIGQCQAYGLKDSYCGQVFTEVQKYCDENKLGASREAEAEVKK